LLLYTIRRAIAVEGRLTDIQTVLARYRVLSCFSGRFSQGIIEEMGAAIRTHMEGRASPKSAIFSVFSIYIEQTQNIKNYVARMKGREREAEIAVSSIVCIGESGSGYFIWSGNEVELADIPPLRARLDALAAADGEELKRLYREQLRRAPEPGASGAGIGLIEMARKARSPLEYSFTESGGPMAFFEIKVSV
jgi:hypothetical protein